MKIKFMHLLLAVPLSLGFEAASALAQERPAITAQPNTVYVGADGKFEAAPDNALVQFNISAQEESSKAAYEGRRERRNRYGESCATTRLIPRRQKSDFSQFSPSMTTEIPSASWSHTA